jgi:SAM-dependent methyltransferase
MSRDTGAALRAQYADQGGVTEVFSSKVADYVASRPDYPAGLFDALVQCGALQEASDIADVGAGTGLLTVSLLDRGHRVTAVEPSDAMRAACDRLLGARPGYRSVRGTAESTSLHDNSIDLFTAAQAFHWFDIERARAEFLRVLKPHGQVALIWNDRVLDDPLHEALDEVFARFGGAKRGAMVAHESSRSYAPAFFNGAPCIDIELPHAHRLDRDGLRSLAFSRSYMPPRESDEGTQATAQLDAVFDAFAADGMVVVRYRTFAIVGRPIA